jgi:hypothetical protein
LLALEVCKFAISKTHDFARRKRKKRTQKNQRVREVAGRGILKRWNFALTVCINQRAKENIEIFTPKRFFVESISLSGHYLPRAQQVPHPFSTVNLQHFSHLPALAKRHLAQ